MKHPCHAARDPLKGAALADRRSRSGGALEVCHWYRCLATGLTTFQLGELYP